MNQIVNISVYLISDSLPRTDKHVFQVNHSHEQMGTVNKCSFCLVCGLDRLFTSTES